MCMVGCSVWIIETQFRVVQGLALRHKAEKPDAYANECIVQQDSIVPMRCTRYACQSFRGTVGTNTEKRPLELRTKKLYSISIDDLGDQIETRSRHST